MAQAGGPPGAGGQRGFSGSRYSRAMRATRGDPLKHHSQPRPFPHCFLPDLTSVKFGSACPPLGRCCRIYGPVGSPQLPFPCACASGNRTDQSATGRLLRRSSGTRFSQSVRVMTGNCSYASATPFILFWFLPDLTRVKFGSAYPPLGLRHSHIFIAWFGFC